MEMKDELDTVRLARNIQRAMDFLVTMKRRVDEQGRTWGDKDVCAVLKTDRERDITYEELVAFAACEYLLPAYFKAVKDEVHAEFREQAEKQSSELQLHAKTMCPLCAAGVPVDMETRKHSVKSYMGDKPMDARCLAFPWRRAAHMLHHLHLT